MNQTRLQTIHKYLQSKDPNEIIPRLTKTIETHFQFKALDLNFDKELTYKKVKKQNIDFASEYLDKQTNENKITTYKKFIEQINQSREKYAQELKTK